MLQPIPHVLRSDSVQLLPIVPLTREAFEPFGDVVEAPRGLGAQVNEGSAERFDRVAALENLRPGRATLNVAYFSCQPRTLPFELTVVEKHPKSAQLFVPLNAKRYIVVVARGAEAPEPLHAFLATGLQGIAYRAGTWHHTLIALDGPTSFACFVWEDGSAEDCIVHPLTPADQRKLVLR